MKVSMAAELAVRGILTLAARYEQDPMPLDEICRVRSLPKAYMTRIFGQLVRANVIRAVRGKGGGYVLARPRAQTTLLEVIEAIEGPLALNLCQHNPPRCKMVDCSVRPIWAKVQEQIREVLAHQTLDKLVSNDHQ